MAADETVPAAVVLEAARAYAEQIEGASHKTARVIAGEKWIHVVASSVWSSALAVQAAEIARLRADRDTLAAVGRLYLDCLDDDPENEMLTLVEAYLVSDVRDAVERAQIAAFPQVAGSEETPDGE